MMQKLDVKSIRPIGRGRVMNLTVKKNHTFLTENGIVTHNCEGMSSNASNSLKAVYEQFPTTRFMMTTNNLSKVIPPLKSRSVVVEFRIDQKDKPKLADVQAVYEHSEGTIGRG